MSCGVTDMICGFRMLSDTWGTFTERPILPLGHLSEFPTIFLLGICAMFFVLEHVKTIGLQL